jgi:putative acetyltransferase
MLNIRRTTSSDPDFVALVRLLDADLAIRDGADHAFYSQFNKIDKINYVLIAYDDDVPVACGAIKEYSPVAMEVKRMFTSPEHRGKGAAMEVLTELESWAREMSYSACVLETGNKQPEAIALYHKAGYTVIPNYGQYAGIENSVCFEKKLIS